MLGFINHLLSYLDPGASNLIVQMLIAGCIGALALFRRAISGIFYKKRCDVSKKILKKESDNKTE